MKRAKRPVNSRNVEEWFAARTREMYGADFRFGRWLVKEKTLAKKLLADYGEKLVAEAVDHLFSNWERMVDKSRGGLSGVPTINLLWGMRARVFGEIQKVKSPVAKKNADEYLSDGGSPDVGW